LHDDDPPARRRVLIVVNPGAGRSRTHRRWLDRIVHELDLLGCEAEVRIAGDDTGDVERLARDAPLDFEVIVAAGGDGTINALINGCARDNRIVALLPLGTANVLAREIGLPRAAERLAHLIAFGRARQIWPGRIGDRLFLVMASSGFDAAIVAAVNPGLKRRFGRGAFVLAILTGLIRYRPTLLDVEIDGVTHCASTVVATKARLYAGPFQIAPHAELGMPSLEIVLFKRAGRVAALHYLLALVCGTLPQRHDVAISRARGLRIAAATALPLQADGEIVGRLPALIEVAEQPIWLLCP